MKEDLQLEKREEKEELDELEEAGAKMSFLEHLEELRRRILNIVIYLLVGFVVCWMFHQQIYDLLAEPIKPYLGGQRLVFTRPTEPFVLYMKVALLASIFLTLPLTIHQVWLFISPGLYRREKKYAIPFIISSLVLFFSGGFFAYKFVLPAAYRFLLGVGSAFQPMIKIDEYLDITNTIILGFGLIFELPVIIGFLSLFGIVTPGFLWRNLKYAILIIAVAAAFLSPTGDAFTMCIYAAPMVVLYFLSIGVSAIFRRR